MASEMSVASPLVIDSKMVIEIKKLLAPHKVQKSAHMRMYTFKQCKWKRAFPTLS